MKEILLTFIFISTSLSLVYSQNYRKIEFDIIGINLLIPQEMGNAAGFSTEARFNVNDKLSFGLRYEWQFFGDLFDETIRELGVTKSLTLASDYYLYNDKNTRLFTGLAIGSFNNEATAESGTELGGSGLGIVPRVGFEIDLILRFTAQYNFTSTENFPNYFSAGVALNIGGRYKETD